MKVPRFRLNDNTLQKAFDKFSDYLDQLPKDKKIIAGSHLRKQEDDVSVTLHGTAAGEGGTEFSCRCPFDVEFKTKKGSKQKELSMLSGFVNGVVPTGLKEFESLDKDAEGYLYLEVKVGQDTAIEEVRPKYKSGEPPDMEWPIGENTVKGTYNVVVSHLGKGFNQTRLLHCGSFSLQPKPVCTNGQSSGYTVYYTMTVIPT